MSSCGWLCRSDLIDKLHNYAFHTARAGHQTQYSKILMMRAVNRCVWWVAVGGCWAISCLLPHLCRYCVHWRLMMHLHTHRTVSNGTEGSCFPYDLDLEHANKYTVAYNQAHSSYGETVEFTGEPPSQPLTHPLAPWCSHLLTGQIQAYKHVDQTYRKLTLQEISTPLEERPSFMAGVNSLLELLHQLIPDPTLSNPRNAFMGKVGGRGLKPHKCDERLSMPWTHLEDVHLGRSGPVGYPTSKHRSTQHISEFIERNQKRFTGAHLIAEGHLPPIG